MVSHEFSTGSGQMSHWYAFLVAFIWASVSPYDNAGKVKEIKFGPQGIRFSGPPPRPLVAAPAPSSSSLSPFLLRFLAGPGRPSSCPPPGLCTCCDLSRAFLPLTFHLCASGSSSPTSLTSELNFFRVLLGLQKTWTAKTQSSHLHPSPKTVSPVLHTFHHVITFVTIDEPKLTHCH